MKECALCENVEKTKKCECGMGPYCDIHLRYHKNNTCDLKKKGKRDRDED